MSFLISVSKLLIALPELDHFEFSILNDEQIFSVLFCLVSVQLGSGWAGSTANPLVSSPRIQKQFFCLIFKLDLSLKFLNFIQEKGFAVII